jgi:hypothetical protein
MIGYPIPDAKWQGPECFMCEGAGHDRAPITGPPINPVGIREVIGYAVIPSACRACNGHGRQPS